MILPPRHSTLPVLLFLLGAVLACAAHASPPKPLENDAGPDTAARTDTTYGFYVGVFHSHTSYSDGVGTPAEAFAHTRDSAGIDFLAVSDHHNQLDADEYADVLLTADAYTEDGAFVALAAQEWTGTDPETGLANHAVVLDADHVFTAPEDDLKAFYAEPAAVDLAIYDVAGRLVKRLVASEARGAGSHVARWDGRDAAGRQVTSGVYLVGLEVAGEAATRKMLLLK